jgi:hypothetical protein
MNLAVAGIDHQPFEVGDFDEPFQQRLPNSTVTPAAESPMGVLPVTVGRW